MKKILIPTDFSENAKNAADYAITMFDSEDTTFLLLHAFYIPNASQEVNFSYNDLSHNNAEEQFKEEKSRIDSTFTLLKGKIESYFEIGAIVDIANSFIEKNQIDILVMGTKGSSGLAEVLVGSIASTMIKKVDCPMIIVPEHAEYKHPEKILFTTDVELQSDGLDISPLTNLAKKHDSKVHALYVAKSPEDLDVHSTFIKYDLDLHLVDLKHDLNIDINTNTVNAIETYIEKNNPDLIAMVSTKGNLFHELFHRSISKKIAMHTEIPMLIMHTNI